jgi:hypothetical protein
MYVKMLKTLHPHHAGDVREFPDREALQAIELGLAES